MAWTPVLLGLLRHCTGSLSQPVLTQPSALSASLGTTARLTCTLSSGFRNDSYVITWFQQKSRSPSWSPPRPAQCLLYYYSDSDKPQVSGTHQGPGGPSCFSGSKDTSANAGILLISRLQPEDEADCHCATDHGSGSSSRYSQRLR
ncbi:unnamed protein product [Nyctereutes procyonoides]|uniref:(raccoon dog) hypothetical protein n=1 Tax=Nyctereutes procyonoides TaxID=34880 RepID=A0A811YFN6_NYCPR|nr:unnamed protein product [Nyctereutes procyonoides]